MNAFERRPFTAEDIKQCPQGDINRHPLYRKITTTYPCVPGSPHLPTPTIINVMERVLGRHNTETLLSGNTPTALMSAGYVIEDHMRTFTVPDKDLQVNLLINIIKENAYVEGVAPINRGLYLSQSLSRLQTTPEFVQAINNVLGNHQCMDVPFLLIERYPGLDQPMQL